MMFQPSIRTAAFGIAALALLLSPAVAQDIDFGDDTSEWANDGECDDPRFTGTGTAEELLDIDLMHDATDCRLAFEDGTVTLIDTGTGTDVADSDTGATADAGIAARIDFGDDTGEWPNDGECDDPDFTGTGMAPKPSSANRLRDATDCRAAFTAGTIGFNVAPVAVDVPDFDYGGDWSKWANDGECDDMRFVGEGTDKKLLSDDMLGDATDCQTLESEGRVSIRTVYSPAYAAGAPYDSSHVDFGDNSSSYANDDRCDDPRFEGPSVASVLLEEDEFRDADDCRAGYEAGTAILISEAEQG